jgi:uncharacterized protein (TIGR02646 family)
MLQLPNLAISNQAQQQLDRWQKQINDRVDYPSKVEEAKKAFAKYNTSRNSTFRQIRQVLIQMCSGACRCGYCEDSFADEVEHIKPKTLYPESVFVWENYLYACGQCNGRKNNKFAVFSHTTGQFTQVTRQPNAPILEPEAGDPVLIDPKTENPLNFLELDLIDTFYFLPRSTQNSRDEQRAEYTIAVLQLNDRDYLVAARQNAFYSYRARLQEYVTAKQKGETQEYLDRLIATLKRMQHLTVWKEIQRQQCWIPTLKELFDIAPEAIEW